MNFENIFKEVIVEMKKNWNLPSSGFLCGGSLANLIWEKTSGNKAVVNDIDIFIYKGKPESEDFVFTNFNINKTERAIYETYSGLNISYDRTVSHVILNSRREDIINYIDIYSEAYNPQSILDSFDINCCQVGYLLEEDKFFYTKGFLKFLETGKLELVNLHTPAHSAIRLAKKADELGVEVPKFEIEVAAISISQVFLLDIQKLRFKEKYHDLFKKYENHLSDKFELVRCCESELELSYRNIKADPLYRLSPKNIMIKGVERLGVSTSKYFLSWVRQVKGNPKLEELWKKLFVAYDSKLTFEEYLDVDPNEDDLELLGKIIKWAPKSLKNLNGLKYSEQIDIIKRVFEHFKSKPLVGISLLETLKIDEKFDFDDEMSMLVLELSLRKINDGDKYNKVEKIFGDYKENVKDLPF
jgi:hypothetical protein